MKRLKHYMHFAYLGFRFLAACICILLPVSAQAQTSKDGNYTYEMYGDGTIQLTGCYLSGDIVIPSKIDGYTVDSVDTLNKTISSLTAGKKYYVKVRCNKTVDGVKYYSGFSAAKSVVC